jgi:transposase-like protein
MRGHHYFTQAECDRIRKLCEIHSARAVAEIVGTNPNAITRLKRRGWKAYTQAHRERPMPDEFPLLAADMTILELRAHYKVSQKAIYRWVKQVGRKPLSARGGGQPKPVPPREDLDRLCREVGPLGAAAHYGVHRNTLLKWRDAYGLPVLERFERRRKQKQADSATGIGWADRYFADRKAA